ncbi:MAG: TetR family transcriptional regulator [Bacillales bacterium]
MPKQTFFNLPASKRNILLEAAKKEFTRAPLFEASIANIVRAAGIPRGSFYQYFEDKEDLYLYLLDSKLKKSRKQLILSLQKHNGDLIEAAIDLYYNFLVKIPDEEERNFLKNAFLYATSSVENFFMDMFHSILHLDEISKEIDKSRLNIREEKDISHILQIITGVAIQNFIRKISEKLSDDEAIEHFMFQINLIKYGIYKRD